MGQYKVLQPVAFMRDGKAVHQTRREVGNLVEVDDVEATPLVEAGKLEPVGNQGPTKTVLDNVKRTEKSLDGDVVGSILDQPEAESPGGEDSGDELGDERTRRRRGRRSESHDDEG